MKTYSVSTLINTVQREDILTADVNLPLKRWVAQNDIVQCQTNPCSTKQNQSTKGYPDYNFADTAYKDRLHHLEINVSKHHQYCV